MNKLVSIKYTSAIFLTIVLVTGIIALSSQSFKTANALSSPLFTEENKYESTGYQPEYTGQKSNIYESTKYKMDRYEKPSYSNDNYQQQPEYSTYITNYESQYSSYGKDNNYKSKDSSSAIIKKINCNNINVNLNGLDINATAASGSGDTNDGAVESARLMENGNANNGGYGERNNNYAQRGNDFTFVCINNNNNTIVVGPDSPPPLPPGNSPPVPLEDNANLIVIKHVINDNGGTGTASDFIMSLQPFSLVENICKPNPFLPHPSFPGSESGTNVPLIVPDEGICYSVSEDFNPQEIGDYDSSDVGCGGIIRPGETKTCIWTNNDSPNPSG